ncbi:MAG: hypothetical protein EU542_07905 [Promethearchaeota archaeon]|nr:MAG: hypothetical protein EU542_07905 [Candidatus Lokiarchaeota archaeon]
MNKKRLIKIDNLRLRKIRKNLRELLLQVVTQKMEQIINTQNKILDNESLSYEKKMGKVKELEKKLQELKLIRRSAPLSCSTCHRVDIDLMYNPTVNSWYCEECYEFNQKSTPGWFP